MDTMRAKVTGRRAIELVALGALVLGLGFGFWHRGQPPVVQAQSKPRPSEYELEVERVNKRIATAERVHALAPKAWTRAGELAGFELDLARLSGDFAGYEKAQSALERGFLHARPGVGPFLVRAELSFATHRPLRALSDLDAYDTAFGGMLDVESRANVLSLRGHAELELGRYDEARAHLTSAIALSDGYEPLTRFAILHWKTGEFSRADSELARAEEKLGQRDRKRSLAFLQYQRGSLALEHGRYDDARQHLERARESFSGWWLIDARLAELDVLEGRSDLGRRAFEALVTRTQQPEHMDALSQLERLHNPAAARSWRERAREAHERRMKQAPEAARAHALTHFLDVEPNLKRAIVLAEEDARARPNGEPLTRLAEAYLEAGRVDDAWREIEKVTSSSWRSAESERVASQIAERRGDTRAHARHSALARQLNPHVFDQ